MKFGIKNFRENLASIPNRVEKTSKGKFSILLITLLISFVKRYLELKFS